MEDYFFNAESMMLKVQQRRLLDAIEYFKSISDVCDNYTRSGLMMTIAHPDKFKECWEVILDALGKSGMVPVVAMPEIFKDFIMKEVEEPTNARRLWAVKNPLLDDKVCFVSYDEIKDKEKPVGFLDKEKGEE